MSPTRDVEREIAEVKRMLAALDDGQVGPPSSEAVYWRARARSMLEEASRSRRRTLRPIHVLHLGIGVSAMVGAALTSLSPLLVPVSGAAGLLVVPLMVGMIALGASLLIEVVS